MIANVPRDQCCTTRETEIRAAGHRRNNRHDSLLQRGQTPRTPALRRVNRVPQTSKTRGRLSRRSGALRRTGLCGVGCQASPDRCPWSENARVVSGRGESAAAASTSLRARRRAAFASDAATPACTAFVTTTSWSHRSCASRSAASTNAAADVRRARASARSQVRRRRLTASGQERLWTRRQVRYLQHATTARAGSPTSRAHGIGPRCSRSPGLCCP